MRFVRTIIAGAALVYVMLSPAPAHAQIPVIDPANLEQSLVQAAQGLEQIHNQIQQIEQQAKMLSSGSLQLSPGLSQDISEARGLFNHAQAIGFQVSQIENQFQSLYPDDYAQSDLAGLGARTQAWLDEDRASLQRSMQAEAQATQTLGATQGRVNQALDASANAEGQTSAVQAGNQLLGVHASQLAEIEALLIAQNRALSNERMERVAREARAQDTQRRAFPSQSGTTLTPARTAF